MEEFRNCPEPLLQKRQRQTKTYKPSQKTKTKHKNKNTGTGTEVVASTRSSNLIRVRSAVALGSSLVGAYTQEATGRFTNEHLVEGFNDR